MSSYMYFENRETANSKASMVFDFGIKCQSFWSRSFVYQTKKVNACGHIPMAYSVKS